MHEKVVELREYIASVGDKQMAYCRWACAVCQNGKNFVDEAIYAFEHKMLVLYIR